ncbi:MAG: ATP-grasp domain-containing protein [Burkholderiaceae bacterium]
MNVLLCGGIRKHHDFLYQAGYDVTWLIARDNQFPEDLKSPPKRLFVYSPDDKIETVHAVAMTLHGIVGFERVFSFHDDSQELAARLAESIGCGFTVSLEALRNTRQKPLMRRRLDEACVPSCWHEVAHDETSLLQVAASCGLPKIIIKPVDGTGSKSVVALQSPAQISQGWTREHVPTYPVLLEEFLEGKEYSVESFTSFGVHYFAGITEKFIDESTFVEIGHIFPADLQPEQARLITDYVARALTALGVDNSPAHTEIMLTRSGPRIIETHTRVGGDWIPTLVQQVTGIDLYELSVLAQMNHKWDGAKSVFAQATAKGFCGIRYTVPPAAGRLIKEVSGIDEAKSINGVLEAYAIRRPGDRTKSLVDSFSRMAYVRATQSSRDELLSTLDRATGCIRYDYEESPS